MRWTLKSKLGLCLGWVVRCCEVHFDYVPGQDDVDWPGWVGSDLGFKRRMRLSLGLGWWGGADRDYIFQFQKFYQTLLI